MPASSKLGSQLRRMLSEPHESAGPAGVMIRVANEPTDRQLAQLAALGARVRTVAGDVLTADIAMDDVAGLAESPFVVSVESPGPMYNESRQGPEFYSDVE